MIGSEKSQDKAYTMTKQPSYEALEKRVSELESENLRLRITERECASNEARLRSLIDIFQHPTKNIQELLEFSLEEAITLTGSKIGYIYHYDETRKQFILNNWSKGAMDACAITTPNTVYNLDETGLWGEVVRQGKPVVVNDFTAAHPLKKGYPEGHAKLRKYLSVPIIHDNRIAAVIGVANKETDYTYGDILHLTLLMDGVWTVVEHKQGDDALRRSEELLRKTQEIAQIGSWEIDPQTGRLTWSDQVYRIFGMDPGVHPMTYQKFLEAVHPEDRPVVDRAFRKSIERGKNNYDIEHRLIRQGTGEIRHVHEKCEHVRDASGKIIRSVGMVADITERKEDERRLRKFNEELELRVKERTAQLNKRTRQLQRLAQALSQAEDRAQEKIATVLHEDIQQILVAARLHLDIIESSDNATHKDILLRKTRDLLQNCLKKTRDLSHDLSPPILAHAGLDEALAWLARRMYDQYGLELTVTTDGFRRPRSKTLERFLFRTARELLFNVVKHAGVETAAVSLKSTDNGIYMTVEDQGQGFTPAESDSDDRGLGIYGIRERIDLLGGRVDIESAPGKGTRSLIFVPDTPGKSPHRQASKEKDQCHFNT